MKERYASLLANREVVKEFDSPSTVTEDSDDKEPLVKRGFKLSFHELGVNDIKSTTGDEDNSSLSDSSQE